MLVVGHHHLMLFRFRRPKVSSLPLLPQVQRILQHTLPLLQLHHNPLLHLFL